MTTILPIGTTVCQACRAPVAVVRRTVEVHCRCKRWEPDVSDVAVALSDWACSDVHVIPDAAWTVVDENGERHRCAA